MLGSRIEHEKYLRYALPVGPAPALRVQRTQRLMTDAIPTPSQLDATIGDQSLTCTRRYRRIAYGHANVPPRLLSLLFSPETRLGARHVAYFQLSIT